MQFTTPITETVLIFAIA